MIDPARLKRFVKAIEVDRSVTLARSVMPTGLSDQLRDLVAHDDWLPEEFSEADAESYRQYLLYCDPYERFCIVSFVWTAGQKTPIHDHTVWGAIGQLRGTEISTPYTFDRMGTLRPKAPEQSWPGQVITFAPGNGDIHEVHNPGPEIAISIHVYGGNIGSISRKTFDPKTGKTSPFVSGYSNRALPNIWQ